jgi:hypothetical protein
MIPTDRIEDYLQRLTPLARGSLLIELERLEVSGNEIPGSTEILARLRAEFPKDASSQNRGNNPTRYFFAPLEPLLVDGAPEHANSGRIQRGSLSPIWEWISRDLLPKMTRDYMSEISGLIAADDLRKARQAATAFQTKIVKSLEGALGSPDSADQARTKLATYTASHAAFGDLARMLCVLRARDGLAKFSGALPAKIEKFDDAWVSNITALLDAFGKNHADALPFALTLVAGRLKSPWQLMRLATKAPPGKSAANIAATAYGITVSMVLDRLDDQRSALRTALRNDRVLDARNILIDTYNTERELRASIDRFGQSGLQERLDNLMSAIAALVGAEVSRFPDKIGHVLGSRSLRRHQSTAERLTHLALKSRNAVSDGVVFCRNLIRQPRKSRA